jgi:hypothetical protein
MMKDSSEKDETEDPPAYPFRPRVLPLQGKAFFDCFCRRFVTARDWHRMLVG